MSNKIQLGLSAVMFFAPLVQNMLTSPTVQLSEEDMLFVQGYVRYGYLTIIMLVLSIVGTVAYYFSPLELLYRGHTFCIFVLFILLIAGTIGVVADFHILQFGATHQLHPQRVEEQKTTIIPAFAPLYNIYLWYKLHAFDTPFWWTKESILWWSCFVLISIVFVSPLLSSFVLILIILRVTTLSYGMDYMSTHMRQKLQSLFRINPEEIRAYLIAGIYRLYALLYKHSIQETYGELVAQYKVSYSKLVPIQGTTYAIRAEWLIATLLGILIVYGVIIHGGILLGSIVGVFLLGRYVLMAYFWKHIPHIPLATELVAGGLWIISHRHNIIDRLYHFIRLKKGGGENV